jgi:hypothetical protein
MGGRRDLRKLGGSYFSSTLLRLRVPCVGGLDVQAIVGDVISADARLNAWFANLKRMRKLILARICE